MPAHRRNEQLYALAAITRDVLADVPEFQRAIAQRQADYFASKNPRFLREVFMEASGVAPLYCRDCDSPLDRGEVEHETCPLCGGKVRAA